MQDKKSILIADDDKVLSGSIKQLLEEDGHAVTCCYSGFDAINLSKERAFDLVLIDYDMPSIRGDLLCEFIRQYQPHGFIVGLSVEPRARAFISAGADTFIHKDDLPRDVSLLRQILRMTSNP